MNKLKTKSNKAINPSEEAQLVAVIEDGCAIRYIKNPSTKIQLAAITENSFIIESTIDPPKEVQNIFFQGLIHSCYRFRFHKWIFWMCMNSPQKF